MSNLAAHLQCACSISCMIFRPPLNKSDRSGDNLKAKRELATKRLTVPPRKRPQGTGAVQAPWPLTNAPLSLKSTQVTTSLWPFSVRSRFPDGCSKSLITFSSPPVAMRVPVRLKRALHCAEKWNAQRCKNSRKINRVVHYSLKSSSLPQEHRTRTIWNL